MPLYEYRCAGCGLFERHGDAAAPGAAPPCPACGAAAVRVFGAPGGRRPGRVPGALRESEARSASEPRRVARADPGAAPAHAHPHPGGRPWQLGH